MLTKQQQLVDVLSKLDNEIVRVVTVTDQKPLKKSRLTGLETPDNLIDVKKYAVREKQFVGVNYEKMVKKFRWKESSIIGKVKKFFTGDKFKSRGTYVFPVTENHAVMEHVKTHKQYFRTLSTPNSPVHSKYYDNTGNDITDQWKNLREEYFKLSYLNKSQELETPVIVNNTTLSNVKYIETEDGIVLYNDLSKRTLGKLGL